MRVYALYIVVAFLIVYAWKDWFKCLCALILMMAFMEHEGMPRHISVLLVLYLGVIVIGFFRAVLGRSHIEHYRTSGRGIIWPIVIEKVGQSPIIGYGRMGFLRTRLSQEETG